MDQIVNAVMQASCGRTVGRQAMLCTWGAVMNGGRSKAVLWKPSQQYVLDWPYIGISKNPYVLWCVPLDLIDCKWDTWLKWRHWKYVLPQGGWVCLRVGNYRELKHVFLPVWVCLQACACPCMCVWEKDHCWLWSKEVKESETLETMVTCPILRWPSYLNPDKEPN